MDFEPVPLDKNMVNTLLRGKILQTKVKRVSLFELSSFNLVFLMYLLVLRSVVLQGYRVTVLTFKISFVLTLF